MTFQNEQSSEEVTIDPFSNSNDSERVQPFVSIDPDEKELNYIGKHNPIILGYYGVNETWTNLLYENLDEKEVDDFFDSFKQASDRIEGYPVLFHAISTLSIKIFECLFHAMGDADLTPAYKKYLPLHESIRVLVSQQNNQFFEKIITKEIDVNMFDSNGESPLAIALTSNDHNKYPQMQIEAVELLFKKGADINCVTSTGKSAFDLVKHHCCDLIKHKILQLRLREYIENRANQPTHKHTYGFMFSHGRDSKVTAARVLSDALEYQVTPSDKDDLVNLKHRFSKYKRCFDQGNLRKIYRDIKKFLWQGDGLNRASLTPIVEQHDDFSSQADKGFIKRAN